MINMLAPLPGLGWLVSITKVYSGVGADIVMDCFIPKAIP